MSKTPQENEIDKNYEAFQKKLPELLEEEGNVGKYSLWHDGVMVNIFDTESDAIQIGKEKYKEYGNFSIQKITREVYDLGYLSVCQ